MRINIPYHKSHIEVQVPRNTIVYRTAIGEPPVDARALVLNAMQRPLQSAPLGKAIKKAKAESAVIVVSDITRPIPYADFLDVVLKEVEEAGIPGGNITILIATGMHRPSTEKERNIMFGPEICGRYRIVDHRAERADELVLLDGKSHAGRPIKLNRHLMEADFRIVTGLVEPHFMAGFSGGRKAICPGLCSLETIKAFHSFTFLDSPASRNGNLEGNPLHEEALSIARQAGVDFCINLIVDGQHRLVEAIAGDLEVSHQSTCEKVAEQTCPPVKKEVDVVLTSCGGYPLDATFYQCAKGMVACLPVVKYDGSIISIGKCSEGIGGKEFKDIMFKYSGNWQAFLTDLKASDRTEKDQWGFQMQTKVLAHVGESNLLFATDGIDPSELTKLSVNGRHSTEGHFQKDVQALLNEFIRKGQSLAVIPEGPYCTPVKKI